MIGPRCTSPREEKLFQFFESRKPSEQKRPGAGKIIFGPRGPHAAAACLLWIQEEGHAGLQWAYDVHRGGCEIMCVCVNP